MAGITIAQVSIILYIIHQLCCECYAYSPIMLFVVSIETKVETKFARCDVHTVMSEDGTSVVNDWLFLEEIDAVNIIVQTIDGEYVFFNQHKYAIPGKTLSPGK